MFGSLNYWQKGILYSLLFTMIVSCIYSGLMVFVEYRLESVGAPHLCSHQRPCDMEDAVADRISLIPLMMLAFGLPLSALAFIAGILMDRFFPKD
jgi:hypothetical protein